MKKQTPAPKKRPEPPKKMTAISPQLSNLRANEREDREAAVRKAVTKGQSPLQARETNRAFDSKRIKASAPFVTGIKPDASNRSLSKLREPKEMEMKKRPASTPKPGGVATTRRGNIKKK
jgi:hypothetical protein